MNTALIDSVFLSETDEEYFYAIWQGDNFIYGGCYDNGALYDTLIALYNSEPKAKPDLIAFAQEVLKSTNS
jgi:hypothetical protein